MQSEYSPNLNNKLKSDLGSSSIIKARDKYLQQESGHK